VLEKEGMIWQFSVCTFFQCVVLKADALSFATFRGVKGCFYRADKAPPLELLASVDRAVIMNLQRR
jgi:hypothetical protein